VFIFSAKERIAEMEFGDDAAERPDIDFAIVRQTEDDLWCSVVSALDVCVDGLALETGGAKIYDFDAGFVHFFKEDVLGLEIGVDYAVAMEKMDAVEDLKDEPADEVEGEAVVAVGFYEFVEVHGEEGEGHALS
jgi:hypothetical protein